MRYLIYVSHQSNIDKIYLYAKDIYEAKYQLIINKWESIGFSHCNGHKAFIEYSNYMDDTHVNIDECNPSKKQKLLILLIYLVTKKLQSTVIELFIRSKKKTFPLFLSHNLILL